jgi:hypothetical protein
LLTFCFKIPGHVLRALCVDICTDARRKLRASDQD